ncbi:MAG: hypothetical protein WDM79_08285 [Terricaulis sp.]
MSARPSFRSADLRAGSSMPSTDCARAVSSMGERSRLTARTLGLAGRQRPLLDADVADLRPGEPEALDQERDLLLEEGRQRPGRAERKDAAGELLGRGLVGERRPDDIGPAALEFRYAHRALWNERAEQCGSRLAGARGRGDGGASALGGEQLRGALSSSCVGRTGSGPWLKRKRSRKDMKREANRNFMKRA